MEYSRIIILLLALALGYTAIDNFALLYKSSKRAEINILVQVLVGSMYFYLGFLLKEYIWRILNPVIGLILFLVFVYLRRSNILLGQGMAWSYYPSGFIVTLICIYLVFLAADILSKYGRYELFRLIGKNSKSIMFFHLLAFTLVDLFLAKLGFFKMDLNNLWLHSKMAYAFPLNLCVSIIFSLAIGYCLKKCSNKIYG